MCRFGIIFWEDFWFSLLVTFLSRSFLVFLFTVVAISWRKDAKSVSTATILYRVGEKSQEARGKNSLMVGRKFYVSYVSILQMALHCLRSRLNKCLENFRDKEVKDNVKKWNDAYKNQQHPMVIMGLRTKESTKSRHRTKLMSIRQRLKITCFLEKFGPMLIQCYFY